MANAGKIGRKSTIGSALAILVLVVLIIGIVAYLFVNPDVVGNILALALAILVIVVIAIIVFALVMALLAVPYYAAKGEEFQTDASYDLDDVKSVKEADSEHKEK